MDADETDADSDMSELTQRVIDELDHGTVVGDKLILSRRAAIAVLVGSTTLTAALGYGSGEAAAQAAAGQVGTSSAPIDVYAAGNGNVELDADVTSTSVTGGYELTIDGDTYQFNR